MVSRLARSVTPTRKSGTGLGKELDANLNEALSATNWGCPASTLHNIAIQTESRPETRGPILKACFQVLDLKDKEWKRVHKALALLEALMKSGSMQCAQDIKNEIHRVRKWQDHRVMEQGKEVAGGIREKCRWIMEMCDDPGELQRARQKTQDLARKMTGMGTNVGHKPEKKSSGSRIPGRGKQKLDEDLGPTMGFNPITEAEMEAASAVQEGGYGKPSFSQIRSGVEQIQAATGCDARRAMQLLKDADYDPLAAIYLAGMDGGVGPKGGNPQTPASPSDSGSDSDDSSSSDDTPAKPSNPQMGGCKGKDPWGKGGFDKGKGKDPFGSKGGFGGKGDDPFGSKGGFGQDPFGSKGGYPGFDSKGKGGFDSKGKGFDSKGGKGGCGDPFGSKGGGFGGPPGSGGFGGPPGSGFGGPPGSGGFGGPPGSGFGSKGGCFDQKGGKGCGGCGFDQKGGKGGGNPFGGGPPQQNFW
mmetsp:Transcript_54309/g.129420  ORF Transcript_54309/g.129420 Transcript_54309/m.129420 type:complete len:471 (-) Transcript_54309:77-1489(-)